MNAAADKEVKATDQDAVVFLVMRDMSYGKRMKIAFALIVLGIVLQWYANEIFAGVIPLILGNLLLLVKGYDNRVDFKGYDPGEQWQRVEASRMSDLKRMDKEMKRWDRSYLDITNWRGVLTFVLLSFFLWVFYLGLSENPNKYGILAAIPFDIAILFLPHWFTGTRQILRMPGLLIKAITLENVLVKAKQLRPDDAQDVMMLLAGKDEKLPRDIKIRLEPEGSPTEFLGLYGQVVINAVQGKSFPYFYMVLVAKPGLKLKELAHDLKMPPKTVAEYKEKDGVHILVLRQYTTRKSGYHTNNRMVLTLLELGLSAMHKLLGK
jgi:hypothetical protein